jgi:hypothetical protein
MFTGAALSSEAEGIHRFSENSNTVFGDAFERKRAELAAKCRKPQYSGTRNQIIKYPENGYRKGGFFSQQAVSSGGVAGRYTFRIFHPASEMGRKRSGKMQIKK